MTYLLRHSIKVVGSCLADSLDNLKPHSLFPIIKPLMEPQGGVFTQVGVVDKEVLGIPDTLDSNPRAHIVKSGWNDNIIITEVFSCVVNSIPLEKAVPQRSVLNGKLGALWREHPGQQFGHLMTLGYVSTLNSK